MARTYYYFIASLPALFFGQKPPMSVEEYFNRSDSALHPDDAKALRDAVTEESSAQSGVAAVWCKLRHDLKNELAYERAIRAGKDPLRYVRGERSTDSRLKDAAAEALNAQDPLEAQRAFDKRAWDLLEELENGHFFDADNVVVYGLKLKILARYEDIVSPKGREVFEGYMKSERLAAVHAAVGE